MGRPRTNRVLPAYASAFTDRHGRERVRFRRQGWQTVYVHDTPGSPEFTQAYLTWQRDGRLQTQRATPYSFDDLISRFYASNDWQRLKPTTQETYRGILERFRSAYGDRSVATMEARHVAALVARMGDTPTAANNLRKRLLQLFRFAIVLGWRRDNPASAVKGLKVRAGGFQTWQEEQIAQFEAHHPLGTMPRLAFDLALYTAQRRSDLRLMGPGDVEDGRIRVKQRKTGKAMLIPMHPALVQSIAATPPGEPFIRTALGKPFTEDGFGMWFMRQVRAAGLTGFPLHGLRKAAARRMAEAGLTNQQIKSITGHTTDSEVSRYTREAEQVLIADRAMGILAGDKQ
jgi:integrase